MFLVQLLPSRSLTPNKDHGHAVVTGSSAGKGHGVNKSAENLGKKENMREGETG